MNSAEKKAQRGLHKKCYVCESLGLSNATFSGYRDSDIDFDHWKPKGLVGANQASLVANQVPIHAHKDGACYLDDDFETNPRRNCHKGKGNRFSSGQEWVEAVRIYRAARNISYSDDLFPKRKKENSSYAVSIKWNDGTGHVTFNGDKYPMMIQRTGAGKDEVVWRSFSTVISSELLFWDREVQSRPAVRDRVAELAIHLRRNPLLSPILCRLAGERLNVFDGNHRLCAFLLARPTDPVPVTILEGPDPKLFLEVVGKAHDELTQQKYQYTAKALKYSALNEKELEDAVDRYGVDASEKLAWEGRTSREVRLRIVGRITTALDAKGKWRSEWFSQGLTDKSWNDFLAMYAKLSPAAEPFEDDDYCREYELANLEQLCKVFDEELFQRLSSVPAASASLKTKWWLVAHKRFSTRAQQVVRDNLGLPETPEHVAYVPSKWNKYIVKQFRSAAKKWADSPAWRGRTTANNQPDVVAYLNKHDFTENYLM